jgi:hypothetical protein
MIVAKSKVARLKSRKDAKSKVALIVATVLVMMGLSACGGTEPKEFTNTGTYNDYTLTLENASPETTDTGEQVLRVNATYTNNGNEPSYAYSCFAVRAFQNGSELTEVSDINGTEAALIQEAQTGNSIKVSYLFQLSDTSEVEVLIGEPTADQTTIGKRTYTLETE